MRRLRVVFSHGESRTFTLQDQLGAQTLTLDRPIKAYWAQFIIDDVYAGQQIHRHGAVEIDASRPSALRLMRQASGLLEACATT